MWKCFKLEPMTTYFPQWNRDEADWATIGTFMICNTKNNISLIEAGTITPLDSTEYSSNYCWPICKNKTFIQRKLILKVTRNLSIRQQVKALIHKLYWSKEQLSFFFFTSKIIGDHLLTFYASEQVVKLVPKQEKERKGCIFYRQ